MGSHGRIINASDRNSLGDYMPSINSPTPDATTLSKGKVQLANNLSGTAALPTVVNITPTSITWSTFLLGSASITSTFQTTSTTVVAVTGLTSSVTIPTNVAKVRVSLYTRSLSNLTSGTFNIASLHVGTVGSGTVIQDAATYSAAAFAGAGLTIPLVYSVTAGASLTFAVGLRATAGTAQMEASATTPAQLIVEAVG